MAEEATRTLSIDDKEKLLRSVVAGIQAVENKRGTIKGARGAYSPPVGTKELRFVFFDTEGLELHQLYGVASALDFILNTGPSKGDNAATLAGVRVSLS